MRSLPEISPEIRHRSPAQSSTPISLTPRPPTPRFTAIRGLPRCAYGGRSSSLPFSPPAAPVSGTLGKTISNFSPKIFQPPESIEKFQLTLRQACSRPRPRAQYAFKDSMIHGILQFTLRIAFRCVLHRCESQDIRC